MSIQNICKNYKKYLIDLIYQNPKNIKLINNDKRYRIFTKKELKELKELAEFLKI